MAFSKPILLIFKSGEENIPVIVKSSDIIKIESVKSSSQKDATIRMESGSGQVLIAYSNDQNRLLNCIVCASINAGLVKGVTVSSRTSALLRGNRFLPGNNESVLPLPICGNARR